MLDVYTIYRNTWKEKLLEKHSERRLTSVNNCVQKVVIETCFYVKFQSRYRDTCIEESLKKLSSILQGARLDFNIKEQCGVSRKSKLQKKNEENCIFVEIGPRLSFSTPWSTNCVSICKSAGLNEVERLEKATRYLIKFKSSPSEEISKQVIASLFDPMTQQVYEDTLSSFGCYDKKNENWTIIDVLGRGQMALQEINDGMGLGFDDWDLKYYMELFTKKIQRNPTSVELFDLAQSNSEHSRHWFFKGKYILDGQELPESLLDMVIATNNKKFTNDNNVIKFNDNSSAIKGWKFPLMKMTNPLQNSSYEVCSESRHIIFTAETHNFPTGVSPFSGATTGTGGRIRDVQAAGRGGHVIAGTAGYCFGNLLIPGYTLEWEDELDYPSNFASPLEIVIEASNGASDYGNKFGEPVICGFSRSFGLVVEQERREWIKPIMFSGGIGSIKSDMISKSGPKVNKQKPEDHLLVKVGGPVYRIGVGGGAASSVQIQGDNNVSRDLGAVQRGDPEMGQKLNRVIRGCLENKLNLIQSIHDQGSGGNANVLKELVEAENLGACIFTKEFDLGDPTVSTLEIWGAEYQESNALLVLDSDYPSLTELCRRERCPLSKVGLPNENKKIKLVESHFTNDEDKLSSHENLPVDLPLDLVLGKMPRKEFQWKSITKPVESEQSCVKIELADALNRVLRLPSVASKRYLTNKVDRSVTGLIAQQQCVGPLQTPIADVAVVALSHFSKKGAATSIGEQPIKVLVNPEAGGRMTVLEAISNLAACYISDLKDVKCSGNWMWPAKLPGEGHTLYRTCKSMCDIMNKLGIAIDGGKDSLSMAARVPTANGKSSKVVKAPGSLVVSTYVPCPDVSKVITPDLKCSSRCSKGNLYLIKPAVNKFRLGGTALSQVFQQTWNDCPDCNNEEVDKFLAAFKVIQNFIRDDLIESIHDISDGGLITTVIEMAMAGLAGVDLIIPSQDTSKINFLFNEETGWVLEVDEKNVSQFSRRIENADLTKEVILIGKTTDSGCEAKINVFNSSKMVMSLEVREAIKLWEKTSYQLEKLQMNPELADEEYQILQKRTFYDYRAKFSWKDLEFEKIPDEPKLFSVAVIREEGTNGDREMAAAFLSAGFLVYDVTMSDLATGKVDLEKFNGIAFPGGFSYADVLGSAVGWAASIRENPRIADALKTWYSKSSNFSFGVCNGCQLMALLGILNVGGQFLEEKSNSVMLYPNDSERFESRWSSVKIHKTNSVMLSGMEDSILGVWIAHGEGKFGYASDKIESKIIKENRVAFTYVDDNGTSTEKYPFNPNGSRMGVAGLTSECGRHLAIMPHPERCYLTWQWPYLGPSQQWTRSTSPWSKIFQNAFDFCSSNQ